MKIRLFLLMFFLSISAFMQAQDGKLLRGEIDAKEYDFLYFIEIRNYGLITIQHQKTFGKSMQQWELGHYSVNLKKIKSFPFHTKPGYVLLDYFDDNDSVLYAFFGANGGNSRLEVLRFNYKQGLIEKSKIENFDKISYDFFNVLNQTHFIAGVKSPSFGANLGQFFYSLTLVPLFTGSHVYSVPPTLLIFNAKTKSSQQKVLELKGESSVFCTRVHEKDASYAMVIRNRHKRKTRLIYYQYNSDGELEYTQDLDTLLVKNPLTGTLIPLDEGGFLFMGTYNEDHRHQLGRNTVANGVFISRLRNKNVDMLKFHPFINFKNARFAQNMQSLKRVERKKSKGEKVDFSFNLLVHDEVLRLDSSYVILAESYYPEYRYISYYNAYGSIYNEQVFDGYRFNNSIVAAFDPKGNLLWDNTFAIKDILSYELKENVLVHFDGETQVLLYYVDGDIISKIIKGSSIVAEDERTAVPTVNDDERVVYESYGKIQHWYDSYFLLSGYQIVSDVNGKRRKVFFFIKIKFD